jgi:hypothetical protein
VSETKLIEGVQSRAFEVSSKVGFESEETAMKQWTVMFFAFGIVHALAPLQAAGADDAPRRLQAQGAAPKPAKAKKLSDAQIRQLLIDESIAAYSGSCPCPYSTMRNGRSCGRRSAHSREGGESPLCYAKDVTTAMVQAYREANPVE